MKLWTIFRLKTTFSLGLKVLLSPITCVIRGQIWLTREIMLNCSQWNRSPFLGLILLSRATETTFNQNLQELDLSPHLTPTVKSKQQ